MWHQRKRIACYIVAIFVFLSGMCLVNTRAHSLLLFDSNTSFSYQTGATLTGVNEVSISNTDAATTEVQNIRTESSTGQQVWRNLLNRREMRLALALLFICAAVPQSVLKFLLTEGAMQLPKLQSNTVILTFIHNTDGEK